MKTQSQNKILKKHLKSGKSIAPLQALSMFGIYRLSARINDLRNDGLNVKTTMVYEHPIKYAKYHL